MLGELNIINIFPIFSVEDSLVTDEFESKRCICIS